MNQWLACYVHFYETLFENKVIHRWTRQYLETWNSREVFQIFTNSASIKANSPIILSCRRCTELWFIPWCEISSSRVYANGHASLDKSDAMTKIRCNETNEKTNDRWLNRWILGWDFARDRSPRRVCTDDIRLLIVPQIKFRDDSTRIAQ